MVYSVLPYSTAAGNGSVTDDGEGAGAQKRALCMLAVEPQKSGHATCVS